MSAFVFISRVTGEHDDYKDLSDSLARSGDMAYIDGALSHINPQMGVLVVQGQALRCLAAIRDLWQKKQSLDNQLDDFNSMMKDIHRRVLESQCSTPIVVAIHWGGLVSSEASALDAVLHELHGAEDDYSAQIVFTYFSTLDEPFYYYLTSGSDKDIPSALEYYYGRALGLKSKIYEMLESILIQAYPHTFHHAVGAFSEVPDLSGTLELLREYLTQSGVDKTSVESLKGLDLTDPGELKQLRTKVLAELNALPGSIY